MENPFLKKDEENISDSGFDDMEILENLAGTHTLQTHLEEQLEDLRLGAVEKRIAITIIQSLEENGLLQLDIDDSMLAYIPAHLTITIPFVIISVGASLQTFEVSLEEAARSLGASRFWAVWYITLPIISPALVAGAIFSFIISFDEFIITFFLTTFERTLPIEMFTTLMYQVRPSIAAVSTLTLAVTAFLTAMLILTGQITSADKVIK